MPHRECTYFIDEYFMMSGGQGNEKLECNGGLGRICTCALALKTWNKHRIAIIEGCYMDDCIKI